MSWPGAKGKPGQPGIRSVMDWFREVCAYFDELPNGHELPIYESILKPTYEEVVCYMNGNHTLEDFAIRYAITDKEREEIIREQMKLLPEEIQFDLTMRGLM